MNPCTDASPPPPWIVFDGTVFVELCVVVVESKSVVVGKEEVLAFEFVLRLDAVESDILTSPLVKSSVTGSVFACAISTCLDRRYLN